MSTLTLNKQKKAKPMKQFYGYIRVSTARQGEHGVSLQEQRSAIERYAQKNNLSIIQLFEEQETAAKRGRPVFTRMLGLLQQGKASGVIIHKIDRSARNLRDWADLGELIDSGIQVHFANESLDLHSRGGRLSADIQAVVASDYIRNLREETKKGMYGRLKQGLLPLPARTGYISQGPGKPKAPDPVQSPLVRRAFELYATGQHNIRQLAKIMQEEGLMNRMGGIVSRHALERILHDPFYMGIIKLKRTGETFPGIHEPIVSVALFQEVQDLLTGRSHRKALKHDFLFRQLFSCSGCGRMLIGELHKGKNYYRCHAKGCPSATLPESKRGSNNGPRSAA
jgi:site-specific DNA recombinase